MGRLTCSVALAKSLSASPVYRFVYRNPPNRPS